MSSYLTSHFLGMHPQCKFETTCIHTTDVIVNSDKNTLHEYILRFFLLYTSLDIWSLYHKMAKKEGMLTDNHKVVFAINHTLVCLELNYNYTCIFGQSNWRRNDHYIELKYDSTVHAIERQMTQRIDYCRNDNKRQ